MSRFPEGVRWVRSDGTPDKMSRIHKEMEWHKYLKEVEHLHTPQTPLRVAYLEFLNEPFHNLIVAEGTKYLGIARAYTLLKDLFSWGDVPFYKVLTEPLKRIIESGVSLNIDADDKAFWEVVKKGQLRIPVLRGEEVIGEVDLFDVLRETTPKVDVLLKARQIPSLEREATLVDALDLLAQSPVVLVDDKALDISTILKALWKKEFRRKKISELNLKVEEVELERLTVCKNIEEVKDFMLTHHKPYAVTKDERGYKVITIEDFF